MQRIQLPLGRHLLTDDSDFDYLNQWKWNLVSIKGDLHVVRESDGKDVEEVLLKNRDQHTRKNGNVLDVRRENLYNVDAEKRSRKAEKEAKKAAEKAEKDRAEKDAKKERERAKEEYDKKHPPKEDKPPKKEKEDK